MHLFPAVICYNVCIFLYVFIDLSVIYIIYISIYIYTYIYIYIYAGDDQPTSITNQMIYVCCGPCGHTRVLCNVHLSLWPVWPHPHESGPNGPATWSWPREPSHMGRPNDVVYYGTYLSYMVWGQIDLLTYAYFFMCSIKFSVILWICLYAGDDPPTSITNSMIDFTADVAIQGSYAGNVRSPLWPV